MNAAVHARTIVYTAVKIAHFHCPLSRLIATNVAIHGKYSRMKTIYARPAAGLTDLTNAFCSRVSPDD